MYESRFLDSQENDATVMRGDCRNTGKREAAWGTVSSAAGALGVPGLLTARDLGMEAQQESQPSPGSRSLFALCPPNSTPVFQKNNNNNS